MKLVATIVLLICSVSFLQAQENKPTKEQTIEYIIGFFKSHYPENEKSYRREDFYFKNEGCLVTIGFYSYWVTDDGKKSTREKTEYNFDISKIESTEIVYGKPMDKRADNYQIVFLKFIPINNQELITEIKESEKKLRNDTRVYLGMMPESTNFVELKIRKAFDHLRKLCGAPDPVKFD